MIGPQAKLIVEQQVNDISRFFHLPELSDGERAYLIACFSLAMLSHEAEQSEMMTKEITGLVERIFSDEETKQPTRNTKTRSKTARSKKTARPENRTTARD